MAGSIARLLNRESGGPQAAPATVRRLDQGEVIGLVAANGAHAVAPLTSKRVEHCFGFGKLRGAHTRRQITFDSHTIRLADWPEGKLPGSASDVLALSQVALVPLKSIVVMIRKKIYLLGATQRHLRMIL